mgnify:CR=1 FL=1
MKFVSSTLKTYATICLVVSSILFYSCEDFSFHNGIKEGRIEYSISYPGIPEGNYVLDLMPKTMETTFSNHSPR